MTRTAVHAEMVRRGIAPHQLAPYWSPDAERRVDPMTDPDILDGLRWLADQVWLWWP